MSRETKDSGIGWANSIPSSWDKSSLRYITVQRDSGSWGTDPLENENDRICIRIADFDYSHMTIRDDREFTQRNYTSREISRLTLRKNDLLVEKSGGGDKTPVGRVVLWDKPYNALYANFIERIRLNEQLVNPTFVQYCLYAFYAQGFSRFYFNQTTGLQNLDVTRWMRETGIPIPPLPEQHRIADFLDSKCSQIDEISKKIQEEIDTLEEYKKSIITEAVTKGLDPNIEMKDSGIEWNPTIPSHWTVVNPKALFKLRNDRAKPGDRQLTSSQEYGIIYQDEYMNLTGTRIVTVQKDFDILKRVFPDDFVISMRSFQGGLEYSERFGSISSAYVMLIPNKEYVYAPFYKWFFKSSKYINAIQSTSNLVRDGQAMRYANFIKVPLFIIPMREQQAIADYLNKKCAEIDGILNVKQQQLSTLEEYKKSMIYEYVTGKKEVPDADA